MEPTTQEIEQQQQPQDFKYFAFISYNAKDADWGRRVQRKLEHYRMPATLCSERGWKRKPIRPVFFAPTDIQPGGLDEELQERLRASRNLIVICSPNSAQSEWVGKEIEFFHSLGRTQHIHFFIIDGKPHSGNPATECFNPVVEKLGIPEILGANIHERNYRLPWLNKERAYVQLVSKLLGVEFDAIWQRHKRQLISKLIAWALATVAVLLALLWVWKYNQPFDARFHLNEASTRNSELPPLHDAIVTLQLENESKVDTISATGDQALFANIPHRFLNQEVHVTCSCPDFLLVDTIVTMSSDVVLNIYRDMAVYGHVHFSLWDPGTERFIPNARVEVQGRTAISDAEGKVDLFIPLDKQRRAYQVKADRPLYNHVITMPCGESDVVEVAK